MRNRLCHPSTAAMMFGPADLGASNPTATTAKTDTGAADPTALRTSATFVADHKTAAVIGETAVADVAGLTTS